MDTSVSLWGQTLGKGTFAQSCYKVLFPGWSGREAGAAPSEVCPLCFHLGASLLSPLTVSFARLCLAMYVVEFSLQVHLFIFFFLFFQHCEPLYFLSHFLMTNRTISMMLTKCDPINSFRGIWWL